MNVLYIIARLMVSPYATVPHEMNVVGVHSQILYSGSFYSDPTQPFPKPYA